MAPSFEPPVLEDVLPDGARVLFCGTAAGAVSARVGAPYAGPGNAFWPTLHATGLLPDPLAPTAFRSAAAFGVALSDLDKHASGSDAEVGAAGFDPEAVAAKVRACRARVVAYTSKTTGSTALGRPVSLGPQPECVGGAEVWVLPSPSGRARRSWDVAPWHALADRVRELAPVVLCAPDKLRGATDATETARALAAGVRDAGGWPLELPVADGGEGTLQAFVDGGHADPVAVRVRDAHGRPTEARIGVLGREPRGEDDGPTVLVEAAEAIALAAVPEDARDVGRASSAGVGDLVRAALDLGAGRILVSVGGSASVDGGAGFLRALGVRAPADGAALIADPTAVDATLAGLDPRLTGVHLELLHDVDAPLRGPDGAARRFGPQKGATPDEVEAYDAALAVWAATLRDGGGADGAGDGARDRAASRDPDTPGSGAAGGLGYALLVLGAVPRPGGEAVLDLVGFDGLARFADLVITAEGSVDASTLQGKTVDAVVRRAVVIDTPVAVLGGRVDPSAAAELGRRGARSVHAIGPADRPLATALAAAPGELRAAALRATEEPRVTAASQDVAGP
ncbi:glycerate kinase [Patulibacter sp.]|uniref:glycerate kinase n=1 Tax=Patulibacter sp. TaxID=1912859 RepID=UPI002721D1FF|nr:glycerate kinase [Patulibacter sp.]MDO9409789.1 glycerate kinase [Patulibacter sp.]